MEINDLIPEVIWMKSSIAQCLNIYNSQTIVMVNDGGEVMVAELKDSVFQENEEKRCMFKLPCKEYTSDPSSGYIWGYGVRDLDVINLDSCSHHTHIVSYGLNDMIGNVQMIDYKRKELLIYARQIGFSESTSKDYWVFYEMLNKKTNDTVEHYSGEVFPLADETYLLERFDAANKAEWSIGNKKLTTTREIKLTKKLTEMNMTVWLSSYSPLINMMVGWNKPGERMVFYSIRWDDTFEDVKIEPFTYQKNSGQIMSDHFQFSPDGKWARTSTNDYDSDNDIDTVTFFHVDSVYPQALSFPVYGGSTISSWTPLGCFLETPTWGTVYVDLSPDFPGYVIVYKMRDVLKKAREKTYTIERIR